MYFELLGHAASGKTTIVRKMLASQAPKKGGPKIVNPRGLFFRPNLSALWRTLGVMPSVMRFRKAHTFILQGAMDVS